MLIYLSKGIFFLKYITVFSLAAITSYHKRGGLKKNFSHSAGGHKFKIKVWTGLVICGGSEGESVPCLSWFLVAVCSHDVCWFIDASSLQCLCPCLHMAFPSVFFILQDSIIDFRAHPNPGWSHGEVNYIYKDLFPNKIPFISSK